ncbi:MAG: HD domain-containing protein [Chloroflexi bacterium]|nr:HD domain-containing protein [Chloroflexota bacterium]MCI0577296.1 HD domain-containing protein [Chloroflexota bacterium]MCI0647740.1 HD domain-containing protein [Chloroflexota bacterium]MCI0731604.1 HD domain-containing protein [Chloroflexota bacterium]
MESLIDRAIGFAARAHEGQQRKTGNVPYIAHPVAVAMLLQRMGCDDRIVAAALLHDTVEDTHVTLEEIRLNFGDEIADIVAGCTEPPRKTANWESRKLDMVARLRDAPLAVKLVMAADKYHNLVHMLHQYSVLGPAVWERFGRGPEQQAWYHRAVLESLLANVAEPERYPIFGQLAAVVDELFDGTPSRPPEYS